LRSRLKEKVDAGRTLRHTISSHGLRPGELKIVIKITCLSPFQSGIHGSST